MSTVVSSDALSAETAAALMDIDGADLEDTGGFASIDNDASDEPTKILMIVGFQEQLNARDLGLALHAHFDAHIRRDETAPAAWLTKLLTLHSLPETDGGPITNTGKAFAICSDVATAKRVLEGFEEQYLEADVDEGFRLKLPSEVTQRLVQEGTLSGAETGRTDQLLICFAATRVLQQCGVDDARDSRSAFPVKLEWGETRFSYFDPAYGVDCWNAEQELSRQASSSSSKTCKPSMIGEEPDSLQQNKKRSRSALIREALKSAANQPADSALAWPDSATLASAVQQAKIDFIREQLAYGVPVIVPTELHAPLAALGIRLGPANQAPSNKATSLPLNQLHALPVKPGAQGLPIAPLQALHTSSARVAAPGASTTSAAGLASAPPAQGGNAAVKTASAPVPPASRFLPARPSSQTISEAAKLRERAKASAAAAVVKVNAAVPAFTSETAANVLAPSSAFSESRQQSLSEMAPEPVQSENSTSESVDVSPKVEITIKSRWDLKESTPKELPTDKPMSEEPPLKKVKGKAAEATQNMTVHALPTSATSQSARAVKAESTPTRSSRRIASGRSSIPAPAQAPPSFPSSSANQGESAAGGDPLTPLEIPSGICLPPPMEGFTRSLGQRDGEIPRNFDFCNPDRMLCLLCLRQFKSLLTLKKHVTESKLHENNLDSSAARRAGAAQLIQTYRPPRPATSSAAAAANTCAPSLAASPLSRPLAVSVPAADLGASAAAAAVVSPVTSTYRDRELERRAISAAQEHLPMMRGPKLVAPALVSAHAASALPLGPGDAYSTTKEDALARAERQELMHHCLPAVQAYTLGSKKHVAELYRTNSPLVGGAQAILRNLPLLVLQRGSGSANVKSQVGGGAAAVAARNNKRPPLVISGRLPPGQKDLNSKVIVSNLPLVVTERQVKELLSSTIGPPKKVSMSFRANGQCTGNCTVEFQRAEDGNRAYTQYNNRRIDGKRQLKIEVVVDPAKATAALARIVAPAATTRGATTARAGGAAAGRGRGARGGASAGGAAKPKRTVRPKKTAEDLD
ncbi:RNA-binding RNA annealing protein, partial [Tilletia horrida]